MREFGQYRLESLIGNGGMGEVHRAYDTRRNREVALKLLPDVLSQDQEYQRRFRRESHAVASLREPHVIPIHDYGEIDNRLFLDMRLVDGQSLAALLAETGPMDPVRAIDLIVQVADALDAAHTSGLVHRDVKPSNILVTPSNFVYVVDFGIAHVVGHTQSRLTMTGATVGTLDYMAPERFDNRPITSRTDVYSLACVLFECLTAAKPFPGDDLPSLMYGHLYLPPTRASAVNPGVPPELDDVVMRGMAKAPDDRYPGTRELAAAARAALTAGGARPVIAAQVAAVGAAAPGRHRDHGTEERTEAMDQMNPHASPVPTPQPPPRGPMGPSGPPDPAYGGMPTVGVPFGGGPQPPGRPPGDPVGPGRRRAALLVVAALLLVAATATVTWATTRTSASVPPAEAVTAPGVQPGAPPEPRIAAGPVGNSTGTPTVGTTIPVGPTPGYIEIAPDGRYAYIANRGAGVLTVLDTTRNVVTGTIAVPEGGPQFVAFAPDGTRAYVSIFNNERTVNLVGVLDTASGTFLTTVPVGIRPFALDVTPDGRTVYVPNHDSGSITVIDTATNTVRRTIEVAPNPHWVDVSEDGTRLYAANHESNVISVIDTATDAVLTTVPVGISPHSILSHPDLPFVYNVNYDSSSMSVIDRNTNTVVATVPTAVHPQDVSLAADGGHGYLATVDDNAIQVFDAETFEITARVPTGRSPTSIAVAPDGRQAYVTNLGDGTVTVLNIAGTA